MGKDGTEKKPMSKGCRFGLGILAIGFVLFVFIGYRMAKAYETFKLAQPHIASLDTSKKKTRFVPLPMMTHYENELAQIVFPNRYPRKNDQDFLASIRPYKDQTLVLAHKIQLTGFDRDWREGVDHLYDAQPKWMVFSKLNGPVVNFKNCRELSLKLNSIGRLLRLENRPQESLRVHLASFSIPRQLISIQKQGVGLMLIDAMIVIAVINGGTRGLLDLGEQLKWKQDLFGTEFQERFEGIHKILPVVPEAMKLERVSVASFFHGINERASKREGHPVTICDIEAIQRRSDYFFPPHDLLLQPYCLVKDKLDVYKKHCSDYASFSAWDYIKGVFAPMHLIERLMQAIAIPNFQKAHQRECGHLARLRGCYLAYAIAGHYARNGAYPKTLDELSPKVKNAMRIDPFTGKDLRYRNDGDTFRLWSAGDKKAINIVPWKRKTN